MITAQEGRKESGSLTWPGEVTLHNRGKRFADGGVGSGVGPGALLPSTMGVGGGGRGRGQLEPGVDPCGAPGLGAGQQGQGSL